jgi:hypothetical protein
MIFGDSFPRTVFGPEITRIFAWRLILANGETPGTSSGILTSDYPNIIEIIIQRRNEPSSFVEDGRYVSMLEREPLITCSDAFRGTPKDNINLNFLVGYSL